MRILGISAYYHDSAACLIVDGDIVAAAQEERFSRKKHDERLPLRAIAYCLEAGGVSIKDIDYVAFYEKPFLKFERLLETYLHYVPRGFTSFIVAIPVWIKQKLWIKELIKRELGYQGSILFPEHHASHAASAFYASPFDRAAVVTMDAVGEWTTTSYGRGAGNELHLLADIKFPHSLGMLYSAFTYYVGFKVNSGEYKLMGLAPYGKPKYAEKILEHLIDVKDDGSFRLNMEYFNYAKGLTMTNARFHALFGGLPRKPESKITQRDMDLARSVQVVTEDIVLKIIRHVRRETGEQNVCLAGGVALNCVANGRLLREHVFENIWIQPAAGDAGGALGAALLVWYGYLGNERRACAQQDFQKGSYLGPSFSDDHIGEYLQKCHIPFRRFSDKELFETVADYINSEKVVGWFQGRMEFGPRALGNRSIVGDARLLHMQEVMNLKIKFRESFRPFAPSILYQYAGDYFELTTESPYMLLVAAIRKELRKEEKSNGVSGIERLKIPHSTLPAVTHVDFSARIQTVHKETNPRYYELIETFRRKYGSPVIVNTSFNVRGEPIVCTPEDAYRCFMRTNMDYLVMGNYVLTKDDQPAFSEKEDWREEFTLD